ncbi:MAG: thiol oxidoreductase, partial [Acidobacteria bacterium]|nr:thiol oxidoreductase [Acidobacteriota bacterium]
DAHSNVGRLTQFVRFLAAPRRGEESATIRRGEKVFEEIGCGLCHTPALETGKSSYGVLSEREVPLYSDLLLHRMGSQLADGVVQGAAEGDMFRTAPLWGLGDRIFLLHDGRTKDLVEAIEAHGDRRGPGEGNQSVQRFGKLGDEDEQCLLIFLRSL